MKAHNMKYAYGQMKTHAPGALPLIHVISGGAGLLGHL